MLELSSKVKETPFKLDDIELFVCEFTIGDTHRLVELQKAVSESNNSGIELWNELTMTRIMCAVKDGNGDYFWKGTLDQFKSNNYPKNMITTLAEEVDKLNPIKMDTLDTKKKSS